jgi:hypothetical protein
MKRETVNLVKDADNYNGPLKLIITRGVEMEGGLEGISCNGVKVPSDVLDNLKFDKVNNEVSKHMFVWNYASNELLIASTFIVSKSFLNDKEKVKAIVDEVEKLWLTDVTEELKGKVILEVGDEKFIPVIKQDDITTSSIQGIELDPKHGYWLGSLLTSPAYQNIFDEFCNNQAILELIANNKKIQLKEGEELNFKKVNIAVKDSTTGELIVSKYVGNLFNRYILAKGYFALAAGKDEVCVENMIGKLVILDNHFGTYVETVSQRKNEGHEADQNNFDNELRKSYKRITSSDKLSAIFEKI